MTVAEKISLLQGIFRQNSNQGILTWGSIPNGYRWTCTSHATAIGLAKALISHVELLGLDRQTFPFRFEPHEGTWTVVFEPVDDGSE